MWQILWKFDLLYAAFFAFVILAYFEVFGDGGVLFYLIHTPYLMILFPSVTLVLVLLTEKRILAFTLVLVMTSGIYLEFFAARAYSRPASTVTTGESFRVCSWNTAYFFQWGRDEGFKRLAEAQCDAIMLQEMWKAEEAKDEIDQFVHQYLSEMIAYAKDEYVFIVRRSDNIVEDITIPDVGGYTSLVLKRNDTNITLVNVHLWNPIAPLPYISEGNLVAFKSPQLAREQQRSALLQHIEQVSKNTVGIIAGDFNTLQNGQIFRDLSSSAGKRFSLVSVPFTKPRNTYPTSRLFIQLDHVLVDRALKDGATLTTSCTYSASDHCLLIIDLVL